jgi:hypothetical protein
MLPASRLVDRKHRIRRWFSRRRGQLARRGPGVRVENGERPGPGRAATAPCAANSHALIGWQVVDAGAPPARLLDRVRHYPAR